MKGPDDANVSDPGTSKHITATRRSSIHSLDSSDGEDSSDDSSSSSSSSSHTNDTTAKERPLANRETREVWIWKLTLLAVLSLSAIVTALAVHMYIQINDTQEFENDFASSAQKVLEAVDQSLETTLVSMDGLAVAIVSHARNTSQIWPEVVVPDFAMRAAKMMTLTDAIWVAVLPLVTTETRENWELFAKTHDQWLNESVHLQETYNLFHGPLDDATGHVEKVWGDFGDIEYGVE
jgi:hypothetical protein